MAEYVSFCFQFTKYSEVKLFVLPFTFSENIILSVVCN